MPENKSSLKDFNTSAKRREAELRFQHDIIGVPANKKELSRIAKDVELGGPSLSNGYQREMVTTVQTLEGLNLPGKEFAAAVEKQLQEISNIYTSNPASEDDTPQEQAALKTIHQRLIEYARKRSTVGSRARTSATGLAQKARGSLSDTLGETQNILGKALSALIRPRENRKIERQREVAAAAMGSSQSAFGVHSPRKVTGEDDESDWGGDFGGDSGLGGGLGGDGGLGGGEVLIRLVNIEDILHEIWQLADAGNTRGEEEAENARQAEEERERDAEQAGPEEKDTSPDRVREEDEVGSKSWLGAIGGILTTVLSAVTGGLFEGGIKGLLRVSFNMLSGIFMNAVKFLGRRLLIPIGSILRLAGGIISFLGGGALLATFAGVTAGWLAGVATIVTVALKNQQIKRIYQEEADRRLASEEAAALGIEQTDVLGTEKSTEALAVEAADKLLEDSPDDPKIIDAMNEAGLDIDRIKAEGFTSEEAQLFFRQRSVQRSKDDAEARMLNLRRFEWAEQNRGTPIPKDFKLTEDQVKQARGLYAGELDRMGPVPVEGELGAGWDTWTRREMGVRKQGYGMGSRRDSATTEHFDPDNELSEIAEKSGLDLWLDQFGGDLVQPPELPSVESPDEFNMTPERIRTMESIKAHEGKEFVPYEDAGGWSVGYGHYLGENLSDAEKKRVYTEAEIDQFFEEDFESHARPARNIPGYENLDPTQQGALEELSYNMGPDWWKGSWKNMKDALERGDTEEAAMHLLDSKWAREDVGEDRSSNIANRLAHGAGGSPRMTAGQPNQIPLTPTGSPGDGVIVIPLINASNSNNNTLNNTQVTGADLNPGDRDAVFEGHPTG